MADEKLASTAVQGDRRSNQEEVASIPLMEERLSIAKRSVESGRVRVHVSVEERQETITENVCRDDLQIERVPRNVPVTETPTVRMEGNTTIIPIVEEVVVVEKRLMLVEEVRISRRSVSEPAEVPVTLRREQARIERAQAEAAGAERE